jgi:hypothetical protein
MTLGRDASMTPAHTIPQRCLLPALLLFLLVALGPPTVHAQYLTGVVSEQGTRQPAANAIVTLFRAEQDDAELHPAGTTITGEDGAFSFARVPPGSYRVSADYDGLSSPLSPLVRIAPGPGVEHVELTIPSRLLMMAATCDLDRQPGAVFAGNVRDETTGVLLPGTRVVVRWQDSGGAEERSAETDAAGRYVLCGVPPAVALSIRAESLGRAGEWENLEIDRPALVLHDMALALRSSGTAQTLITQTITEVATGAEGDLRGQLLDQNTDGPIRGAVVRIRDTRLQAVSDNDGNFAFQGIRPNQYVLEIHHLGYSVETGSVDVPRGQDVTVRFRLAPRAVELEAVEARARSADVEVVRTSPFRRAVVAGEALAREQERGAAFSDVLRRHLLGLRVREHSTEFGTRLCLETNRRIQRLEFDVSEELFSCAMVQVVIDGVRIPDDEYAPVMDLIQGMAISEIESLEYLAPVQAATYFGIGGNVSNGALVIYTRGKGPYRSGTRNPG